MSDNSSSAAATVVKIAAAVIAWIGSVSLAQVQTMVAIVSGLAVLVFTIANTYFLIRDKRRS